MTVSTEVSREEYTGNGVTTDFDYRFRVFSAEDLVVSVADTTETISVLTLNTDYTVTGAGSRTGGKVKLLSPLAFNWRISIERALPVTQETDIRNQGNFFPEVHEDAFDKLTMLIQQVWSYFGLALRRPNWLAKYYDAKGYQIASVGEPHNPQDAATKNYVDTTNQSWFKRTLRVPESYVSPIPPVEMRRNMLLACDDAGQPISVLPESGSAADVMIELAKPTGAYRIGYNGTTVGDELDLIDFNTQYFINGKRKLIVDATERTDFKYAAFCDGCLVAGIETFIHREGSEHLDGGGGKSKLVISVLNKQTGGLDVVREFAPIAGKDYRDPSITYIPETKNIIVSCQVYDVAANSYNGGTVWVLGLSYNLINQVEVGAAGYFQWGKVIRTPGNRLLLAAYKVDGTGIGLFTSAGNPFSPVSFTKTADIFNDNPALMRNEVAIHYYNGYLVAFARTQNRSDESLQNASVMYTADQSGALGWTTPTRLDLSTVVAPRMYINTDGGLVLSAGSIFGGKRGSVSTQVTFDLTTYSARQTVYRNASGDGGYSSAFLSDGQLVIYTYNETEHLTRSNTYLEYFNPESVTTVAHDDFTGFAINQVNGVAYLGGNVVYNSKTLDSGYVSIFVNKNINNVTGVVFAAELSGTAGPQYLLLQKANGDLFATLGPITVTTAGVYISYRDSFNIPAGVYRLTLPNSRLLYLSNALFGVIPNVPYTTINADSLTSDIKKHVSIGFVI